MTVASGGRKVDEEEDEEEDEAEPCLSIGRPAREFI